MPWSLSPGSWFHCAACSLSTQVAREPYREKFKCAVLSKTTWMNEVMLKYLKDQAGSYLVRTSILPMSSSFYKKSDL